MSHQQPSDSRAGDEPSETSQRTPRLDATTPGLQRRKRRRRSSARRRKMRRIRRRIYATLAVLGILVFAFAVLAILRIQKIAAELEYARFEAEQAIEALNRQELAGARSHLALSADAFVRAGHTLGTAVELKIAKRFPVAGENLRAISAIASAGAATADASKGVLEAARRIEGPKGELVFPLSGGQIDLDAVEALQPSVRSAHIRIEAALAQVVASPATSLVGVVGEARSALIEKLTEAESGLEKLDDYLSVLPGILGQKDLRRYFVAIGNNAEMNASGMILSYGIIEAAGGRMAWTQAGPVTDIKLSEPAAVPLEPEFFERWGWANPTFAWQRTNVTPDFPTVGEALVAMYKSRTGVELDGAIFIDGVALGYLLRATGPIAFRDPAVTLDERNFAEYAMNGAYTQFATQDERKEFLGVAAQRAISAAFQISGDRARTLGSAFDRGARERRFALYSTHQDEQSRLAEMALGGRFPRTPGNFVSYALENFSGNKLDYYVKSDMSYSASVRSDGSSSAAVKIRVENPATDDLAPYILGGDPRFSDRPPGNYFGYLTVYAPVGSFVTGGASRADLLSVLPDAGYAAFSVAMVIPPGAYQQVDLEISVPPPKTGDSRGVYELLYVPQPRFRPESARVEVSFESGRVSDPLGFAVLNDNALLFDGRPEEAVELAANWSR